MGSAFLSRTLLLIASLAAFPGARADVVPDWNLTTAQALHAAKAGTGLAVSRVHAMVHGAMFDAVNAIERRYRPYAADLQAAPGASQHAAAAAAAHAVLAALYPPQRSTLDAALAASLAKLEDGPAKAAGVALGKAAAEKMLALRRDDRMGDKVVFAPKTGPGAWQLAANTEPVGPHWGKVAPFALKSLSDFRFAGPPPLKSARYARDLDEVKALGAKHSTQRTAEQAAIGLLWEPTSPLTYNAMLRQMPELKQKSLLDQARVFALMNMAGSDAIIAGWDAKYAIQFWRPDTAIRAADSDGNDSTAADPAWEGLRSTMPAHPEYPSGHGVFTGAVEVVLRDFFGTDKMSITVSNPDAKLTRTFESFSQIAKSVEDARVWLGIHFRSTVVDSSEMGRRVGQYVVANCMQPISQ